MGKGQMIHLKLKRGTFYILDFFPQIYRCSSFWQMGIYVEQVFSLSQALWQYLTFCDIQFAIVKQTKKMTGNPRQS